MLVRSASSAPFATSLTVGWLSMNLAGKCYDLIRLIDSLLYGTSAQKGY